MFLLLNWKGRTVLHRVLYVLCALFLSGVHAFADDALVARFLKAHCYQCHDQREAQAGFRVDQLSLDWKTWQSAEQWLEVMDHLNLGSMPPEDEPRPNPDEAFKVVKWIASGLKRAETAARSNGGLVPMRRLNRDEYANTIRDLLLIDEKLIAPIVEELPGDGKAEGFDRLGVALFFDQTQIERSLAAAEAISKLAIVNAAPPPRYSLVWQPEKTMARPEVETDYSSYSGVVEHRVKTGAQPIEFQERGVRWTSGLDKSDNGPKDDPWRRMAWINPDLSKVVTQDGWYRVRILAGASRGRRNQEPVRVKLHYAEGTPIHQTAEIEIDAPLDAPKVFEKTVFLRRGPDGVQRRLEPWWNPLPELIASTKAHHSHVSATIGLEEQITEAMERGASDEELAGLRLQLTESRKRAASFRGPVREFTTNPRSAPQLFVDSIQVDGPYPSANPVYETEIPITRFEAEQERTGGMGIRPPSPTENNRFVVKEKVPVAAGPPRYRMVDDGVVFVQGGDTYQKGNPWGRLATVTVDDLIPEDGYYRIRVRCGADAGTRGAPIRMAVAYNFKTPQEQIQEVEIKASTDDPDVFETVMFIRRGADDQRRKITLMYNDIRNYVVSTPTFNQLFQDTIGTVGKIQKARSAGDAAEVQRLESFLVEARQRAAAWKGPVRHIKPEYRESEPPTFFLDWMEIEGPLQEEWPPASHKQLLFAGDDRYDMDYAREIFERFLPRAYRRPVSEEEVNSVVDLVGTELIKTNDFPESLRVGLQRVLTSPSFLFIRHGGTDSVSPPEEDGHASRGLLDDYALASRLSYFLWSTMPDEELLTLAESGTLNDPKTLGQQVDRMLKDPRSGALVENFAGQWLSIREFGSVMPAADYRDYDAELEAASKQEAYAFFGEVLKRNLAITNFLDSDFVMINERLAKHYGIEGISGDEIRRVKLKPEHHRGGVLGMAGLMTLLSDGTRTLPVRRANWIVSNLFNDPPPPPPPNAGEVQPNTAGEALTVRQRLEKHRDDPICASCHRSLDPFGLALENYDAIGAWRTRQNGEEFRGRNTPELDVSGNLPSGRSFTSLEAFKSALVAEKDEFATAFTERLMTYALCRPVGYMDRDTIQMLTADLKKHDYRIQALIQAIVQSETFRAD